MKALITVAGVFLAVVGSQAVAFACSCARVSTFEQVVDRAPVVAVGSVRGTDEEAPQLPDGPAGETVVRAPFGGEGIAFDILTVVKGRVSGERITVWNPYLGECSGGRLRGAASGALAVIAIRPLVDVSEAYRRQYGLAFLPRPTDYLVESSGCGQTLRVVTKGEATDWVRRRVR